MEVPKISDESDENKILNTEDILEQEFVREENTFHEVKKTVEDIAEILAVVKEDILEIIIAAEDTCGTLPVIENDLETDTAAKDILQFVKTNENISDSSAGSENKTEKNFESKKNPVLFQKNIGCEIKEESVADKVSEGTIAKEAANTQDNTFPSREDIGSLKEMLIYLASDDSNKIPFKKIVENIYKSELLSHYAEYRKDQNNNLSKLYDSRVVIDDCLEESSFITHQCRTSITHIDSKTDLGSESEQELKTRYKNLMEKVKASKECLRSLGWNLDCVDNKTRQYKNLNNTIDIKRDKFLSCSFSNEKKKD